MLVILGLLVGGVISGQSLIRAAALRSVATDFSRYATAIQTFRDKYSALPGDMPNATRYWGIAGGATGNDATCYNTVSTGIATCNGNGNGRLYYQDGVADNSAPEWFRAWQHLANAGMIEGKFTGTADGSPRQATLGRNVPRSRISETGYTLFSITRDSSDTDWWSGNYDTISHGARSPSWETRGPVLRTAEAWNIDTKLDDGKPGLGLVRTFKEYTDCNTSTTQSSAQYNLSYTAGTPCAINMAIKSPGTLP